MYRKPSCIVLFAMILISLVEIMVVESQSNHCQSGFFPIPSNDVVVIGEKDISKTELSSSEDIKKQANRENIVHQRVFFIARPVGRKFARIEIRNNADNPNACFVISQAGLGETTMRITFKTRFQPMDFTVKTYVEKDN